MRSFEERHTGGAFNVFALYDRSNDKRNGVESAQEREAWSPERLRQFYRDGIKQRRRYPAANIQPIHYMNTTLEPISGYRLP